MVHHRQQIHRALVHQRAQHVHRGLVRDFVAAVHAIVDQAVLAEGAHGAHHFRRRLVVAHAPFAVGERQGVIGRRDAGRGVAAVDLRHREIQRKQHPGARLGFLFDGVAMQVDQAGHQGLALQVDLAVGPRADGLDGHDAPVVDQHGAVLQHAVGHHDAGMRQIEALHDYSRSAVTG
ncbi:hypothetical protein D3C71_1663580 [compost metagenome]